MQNHYKIAAKMKTRISNGTLPDHDCLKRDWGRKKLKKWWQKGFVKDLIDSIERGESQ